MDKTDLVGRVKHLFELSGHKVVSSVEINHTEIDVLAEELHGLVRKKVLVECTEEKKVGVPKLRADAEKLRAAMAQLGGSAVPMHVALNAYTTQARGYAQSNNIDAYTLEELETRLVNFDEYVNAIEREPVRQAILDEYQETRLHFEGHVDERIPAFEFFDRWLENDDLWLTVLGDYGVGKSWMLRRLLYRLLSAYKESPSTACLPFFVPLQRFTKAFDLDTLFLATFATYGLSGVHLDAFKYLVRNGRILFLFDSFDEMAQSLSRNTLRENLQQLVSALHGNSRAIMTSRPTYFESRAERLLVSDAGQGPRAHRHDQIVHDRQTALTRFIEEHVSKTQFARLNDLTHEQRRQLFQVVLHGKSEAKAELESLFERFKELQSISQRAVLARLLTTVAETLAVREQIFTPDGFPLLPEDLSHLNQAKIFEIVVNNLLHRDKEIGDLSAADRLRFLRRFAVHLQHKNRDPFAKPCEIREIVDELFAERLRRTDAPEQLRDNFYRTCRRHSGLTTEGQFHDTTGNIDTPVDERDVDSRVGFSHNSLREYLVADALSLFASGGEKLDGVEDVAMNEAIGDFFIGIARYQSGLFECTAAKYEETTVSRVRELLFEILFWAIGKDAIGIGALGRPPNFHGMDLSLHDLSGLKLFESKLTECAIGETDFREADLRKADFCGSIVDNAMLDGALVKGADFRSAAVESIYVYDDFNTRTTSVLADRDARQWLFSRGALVAPTSDLNPLLGDPRYEAAREVAKTACRRIAGTFKLEGLSKGVQSEHREFAIGFAEHLVRVDILQKAIKSKRGGGGWVVKVNPKMRECLSDFSEKGAMTTEIERYFKKAK